MAKMLASAFLLAASQCGSVESVVTTKTTGDSGHESTDPDTTLPSTSTSGESSGPAPTSSGTGDTGSSTSATAGTTGAYESSTGDADATTDADTTTGEPGPCSGELLADKLGNPWSFARQGDFIYFTTLDGKFIEVNVNDDGGVWRVPVDGGTPELLVGQLDGMWIATSPTHVFWSQETGGLKRANLDGTAPQSLMLGARPLGVDADHLFAATTISIERLPLAGGPREQIVGHVDIEETWYYSYELALDDQRVYWTTGGTVESVGKDGTERRTHATGQKYPGGVASDGEHVFWLDINDPAGCTLRRTPVGGGAVEVLWTDPTPFMIPRDCSPGTAKIVLDDQHVYWGGDLVQRVPKAGGPPEVVAECDALYVRDIIVDDTHVYWLNHAGVCGISDCLSGSLWRTLKPK